MGSTREAYLQRTYGISEKDYENLLEAQDHRCAVCRKPWTKLVVDHDHKTGRVRGLLCQFPCNYQFIGRHRDPDLFLKAYEYLSHPPADAVLGSEHTVPVRKKSRRKAA